MPLLIRKLKVGRNEIRGVRPRRGLEPRMSLLPEPFQIPAFRSYWLARLATTIGQMAMVIVIGWQVYDIARETMGLKEAALRLGIIGLVQFVPVIRAHPGDRLDRRPARPALDRARLANPRARLRGRARAIHLHRLDHAWRALCHSRGLLGVARAFAGPALGALAPNLVSRANCCPKAIAVSSIAWQAGIGRRPGARRLPLFVPRLSRLMR